MSQELATLETLRQAAGKHVAELEKELDAQTEPQTLANRAKSVASLRALVKTIEEIADLEKRFKRPRGDADQLGIDDKQRQDLAKRIEALRCRD